MTRIIIGIHYRANGQGNTTKGANMSKYEKIDFDFGTPSRFDLEDAIHAELNVNANLQLLMEDMMNKDDLDKDDLLNTLQGIINIHQMQHNKLWDVFTMLFKLDDHNGH